MSSRRKARNDGVDGTAAGRLFHVGPWCVDRVSPVAERRSTNGRDDDSRRAVMTTTVDVSRATDAVREVRRDAAVQTTLRQNTEAEAYPLRNWLPVEVAEEPRDVFNFRAPREEHKSGGTVMFRTD